MVIVMVMIQPHKGGRRCLDCNLVKVISSFSRTFCRATSPTTTVSLAGQNSSKRQEIIKTDNNKGKETPQLNGSSYLDNNQVETGNGKIGGGVSTALYTYYKYTVNTVYNV